VSLGITATLSDTTTAPASNVDGTPLPIDSPRDSNSAAANHNNNNNNNNNNTGEPVSIQFAFESAGRAEEWRAALQSALDKWRKKHPKEKKPSMMRRIASKFSSKKARESHALKRSGSKTAHQMPVIPESWR
jgi:hypothetical protein